MLCALLPVSYQVLWFQLPLQLLNLIPPHPLPYFRPLSSLAWTIIVALQWASWLPALSLKFLHTAARDNMTEMKTGSFLSIPLPAGESPTPCPLRKLVLPVLFPNPVPACHSPTTLLLTGQTVLWTLEWLPSFHLLPNPVPTLTRFLSPNLRTTSSTKPSLIPFLTHRYSPGS